MNRQQQIDIITAHMAGKQIMVRHPNHTDWTPLVHNTEYRFDFQYLDYKIEPRKVELFIAIPPDVLEALVNGEQRDVTTASVCSGPVHRNGWTTVRAIFIEPNNI